MGEQTVTLDESLGFLIYRVYAQTSNHLRKTFQSQRYDCTPEQWGVLARLRDEEGVNQSRLGELTFKDRHNTARILDLLEKRGLIERRVDGSDRRAHHVFLTEAGRKIEEQLKVLVQKHQAEMFEGLSAVDIAAMRRIFAHIVGNAGQKR